MYMLESSLVSLTRHVHGAQEGVDVKYLCTSSKQACTKEKITGTSNIREERVSK